MQIEHATEKIKCRKCQVEKTATDFYPSMLKPGRYAMCKDCFKSSSGKWSADTGTPQDNELKKGRRSVTAHFERNRDMIHRIVAYFIDNPKATYVDAAQVLGLSPQRINWVLKKSRYMDVFRKEASAKISAMIPLAVKGVRDSILSDNSNVKYSASIRVLENERIIGPEAKTLNVNDLSQRSIEELRAIIAEAKSLPDPNNLILEGEIIE